MSRSLAVFFALAAQAGSVSAQDVYGPVTLADTADEVEPMVLEEDRPCEEEVHEEGAIVVCRELPDSQRYMSPLPGPIESDRPVIPGLTDPPCWVENRGGVCIRMGWVPPYPPLVDLTIYPEPLSEEHAAAVSAVETGEEPRRLTGERVPIDLSGEN